MRKVGPQELRRVEEVVRDRHPLYFAGMALDDVFPFLKGYKYFQKKLL